MITTLELESSHVLRSALLRTMVINLSGKPGGFSPCDLIQEYFNRMLEFIVERKGKEFDHRFIQQVISRNLHRLSGVKIDSRTSVGLNQHARRHTEPHSNPEIRILLKLYTHHQLHSRRAGRFVEERHIDDFSKGLDKLRKGKLAKWVRETTQARVKDDIARRIAALPTLSPLPTTTTLSAPTLEDPDMDTGSSGELESESEAEEDSDPNFRHTVGVMEVINGRFVAETLDIDGTLEEAITMLDEELENDLEYADSMNSDSEIEVCSYYHSITNVN